MHFDERRSNAISTTVTAAVIIIVIVVAAIAVYASVSTKSTATTTVVTTLSPIKIGYITSLSGVTASGGSEGLVGAQLAVNQINNKGGVGGRPLQLVVLDDQASATVAVADATEANTVDNVLVMAGSAFAGASAAIRGYAETNKVPYIDLMASDPTVTAPGTEWSVRVSFDSVTLGATLTEAILAQNPNAKIAIGYVNDISYFTQILAGIQWEVKTSGHGSIVSSEGFPIYQTDFTASVAAIKAANPTVIIDLSSGSAAFYADLLNAGFTSNQVWIDTDQPTDLLPLGNTAQGVYALSWYASSLANSTNGVAAFNQEALPTLVGCTQCGHTVTFDSYYGYIGMYVIANAALHAESNSSGLTRASFMSALKQYPYYDPILQTTYKFASDGATVQNIWIVQISSMNATAGLWTDTILQHYTIEPGQIPAYQINENATG